MGCVYTGFKTNRSKNGFFKVGMTEKDTPASRLSSYNLQGIFYFEIPKATKAELLFIEAAMRVSVERMGLRLNGNDCFYYMVNRPNKLQQIKMISQCALSAAQNACAQLNLNYNIHYYNF